MTDLIASAASGDRLQSLRDARDVLARAIVECESHRDLSGLMGRFQSILDQIAALEPPKEAGDGIDEIAERRTARRASTAKGSVRTSGAV